MTEEDDYEWARRGQSHASRSLEADIVDWADDVAYAVHDLEDFVRAGLIPLEQLSRGVEDEESQRFLEANEQLLVDRGYSPDEVREAFGQVFEVLTFPGNYRGLRSHRAGLRQSTSNLISNYIGALKLNDSWKPHAPEQPRSLVERGYKVQVDLLKRLTWFYVIDNPSLALQQAGQRRAITFLFHQFAEAAFSEPRYWTIFPEAYRERLAGITHEQGDRSLDPHLTKDEQRLRLVVDFIASMTEPQALEIFARLSGSSYRSALEALATM